MELMHRHWICYARAGLEQITHMPTVLFSVRLLLSHHFLLAAYYPSATQSHALHNNSHKDDSEMQL